MSSSVANARRPEREGARQSAGSLASLPPWVFCKEREVGEIRAARLDDLTAILSLFGADPISSSRSGHREEVSAEVRAAFEEIEANPQHSLWVLEEDGQVLGTYQLSLIPGLARNGMRRAIVESVHVLAEQRSRGLGEQMMRHAMAQAISRGCGVLQLTTDKRRTAAHRFYRRLGFIASHEGMKLDLSELAAPY